MLHLVFGGELKDMDSFEFRDPAQIDVVGIFPDYDSARPPGVARRRRRSTTPRPAISSFTSIVSSNPKACAASRPDRTMFKSLGRSGFVQEALGFLLAAYLRLVQRTTRFRYEPADLDAAIAGQTPLIVAMWHGQHLMISFAWPRSIVRMAALISRSVDGGAQASALRRLGVKPVRGSGGRQKRKSGKGGAPALRGLVRELDERRLGGDDRRCRQARAGRRASASSRWRACRAGRLRRPPW